MKTTIKNKKNQRKANSIPMRMGERGRERSKSVN